jgi:hypothetical protein
MAMARAVRSLQNWSGRPPSQSISAVAAYGTIDSSTLADAPGTCNKAEIAPLPPPVTASTSCFPDVWISSMRADCVDTIFSLPALPLAETSVLHGCDTAGTLDRVMMQFCIGRLIGRQWELAYFPERDAVFAMTHCMRHTRCDSLVSLSAYSSRYSHPHALVSMVEVVEVNDIEELSEYRMVWNALFAGTPNCTFFQTFDWLDLYWRHFGASAKLRVLIVYSAGEAVGILPLCVRRELCSLGKVRILAYPIGKWATWYGPIGPNPAFTMLAAAQHIRRTPRDWDIIELRSVADEGMQGGKTARGLRAAGLFSDIQAHQQTSLIDLSSMTRDRPADKAENLQSAGDGRWRDVLKDERFEYIRHRPLPATEGDGDPRWDLHSMCESAGLGSSSSIANGRALIDTRVRDYFRATHESAARLGMLDMSLLLVDGRPTAFAYGYHRQGSITGLQTVSVNSNRDEIYAVSLHMLKDSCRRGDHLIDLGPGVDEYKRELRTRTESTYRITYTPPGSWRSHAVRFRRWAKRHLAKRANEAAIAS